MGRNYRYEYEYDVRYCYPGSNVLKNKLNITDMDILEEAERRITSLRTVEAMKNGIRGKFDFDHLKRIHKFLFGDIYDWAGKVRLVNISKGNQFCRVEYIEQQMIEIFEKLQSEDYLQKVGSQSELAKRLAYYLGEINAIHPFREGNTRTCVTFLWHYLQAHNIEFHIELIRNNPMYVRDSLVMANYEQKEYLTRIITDAILGIKNAHESVKSNSENKESYRIAKSDYDAFKAKYSVKK